MKPAILERLNDLRNVANHLAALLEAEDPAHPLPGMALARAAVAIDAAANQLANHAIALEGMG
jgi:hypothetical protein